MGPLADFFDRPLLRKFLVTTLVIIGVWLVIEVICNRTLEEWSSEIWFEVMYLIPLVWFVMAKPHRQSFASLFRGFSLGSFNWFHLVLILALGLVSSFGIDNLMSMLVATLAPDYITDALNMNVIEPGNHWMLNLWMVLGAVVVAPFMEELVFRGLLYERLSVKWSTRNAALVSSLIFGLLHAEAWLGAGLFGLLMCLVYHHTKNLWIPIILHMTNNLIVVLLMYFEGTDEKTLGDFNENWPFYLAALLVLPALYFFIKGYFPSEESELPYRSNVSVVS